MCATPETATGATPLSRCRLLCDDTAGPVATWREHLDTADRIEVEIGCGRGTFLLSEARRRPECGFLGVETSGKWAQLAALALAAANLGNAAVVRAEAVEFLRSWVATESVQAVHVYFPDPWPRGRHEKRRIWRPEFVREVLRILSPGGRILTATDIRGYFVAIQALLTAQPGLEQRMMPGSWPLTVYAQKFLERGRPVFSTMFVKLPSAPLHEDDVA